MQQNRHDKKVLFVWEFGGHLGHILNMLPIARELKQRGFKISFALKDLSRANLIYEHHPDFTLYQAPVWLVPSQNQDPPLNIAQVLQRSGYKSVQAIESLIKGWMSIYEAEKPDIVIYDYALTAMLAYRGLPIKQATLGTGFYHPTFNQYAEHFSENEQENREKLILDEKQVVININQILTKRNLRKIKYISDLNKVDRNYLCTFPELDHFGERKSFDYCGAIIDSKADKLLEIKWIKNSRLKKVFAYLKPGSLSERIIKALQSVDCQAHIFMPGLSLEFRKKYQSKLMFFSTKPFQLISAAQTADLAVSHAGHGTLAGFLLYGCPVLVAPLQMEQYMLARKVHEAGFGEAVYGDEPSQNMVIKINKLLYNDSYRQKVESFSSKYQRYKDKTAVENIGNDIAGLL